MSEWISVKDRLPEVATEVLFYTTGCLICAGYISCLDQNWYTLSTGHDDLIDADEVLFWMPLPDAPEVGGVE